MLSLVALLFQLLIALCGGVDSAANCQESLPFYVDVGRYQIPERLDIDLRIRNGVVKNESLRLAQLNEYALQLGQDMANQTVIKELHNLFRRLNKPELCISKGPCKFTDTERFAVKDMERVYETKLDRGPARNILNIGGGSGMLSFLLWKVFGHQVDTCDIPSVHFKYDGHYPVMASFFGLTRRHWFVTTNNPPSWLGTYDVVLIYLSVFNHKWNTDDYKEFLVSLMPHIAPGGFVRWHSNQFRGAKPYGESFLSYDDLVALAEGQHIPFHRYKLVSTNSTIASPS